MNGQKDWIGEVVKGIYGQVPAKYRGVAVILLILVLFAGSLDNFVNRSYGLSGQTVDAQTATITAMQDALNQSNVSLGEAKAEIASLRQEVASVQLDLKALAERCDVALATSGEKDASVSMGNSVATRRP